MTFTAYRRVLAARDRALLAEHHALENELSARRSAEHARHSLGEVLMDRSAQALLEGASVDAEFLAAQALDQEERADARGVVLAARSALRPTLAESHPKPAPARTRRFRGRPGYLPAPSGVNSGSGTWAESRKSCT